MRLHILGSGCPHPSPDQFGSSFILDTGSDLLMVDCGPATTYKMAKMGIRLGDVGHLFLTHLHFDHNVDFPCFALTRWDQDNGSDSDLKVYGPPPTQSFVDRLLGEKGAFYEDWYSRIQHPASHECHTQRGGALPRPAPSVVASDAEPGKVVETDSWTATAERVHHVEPWLESLAYRFETQEGSIAFAGDCGDCPELRKFAQGVDTLVVACTHRGRSKTSPAVGDVITGNDEVVAIATEAGVKRVILTHVSPGYAKPGVKESAVAEIARGYDGTIVFPPELSTVEL